ncbi:MAG: CRISPR-associated endonuclease Cas2 [Deltaproteobacteria bacterium]|nr:CRISPR-associated endonuclease Cas2 [Deltaproteobacteria bacterium]MBF0524122.1 CRISPR-associated endonuclease Cas2 [Deltaproteobacteria bacterium]
MKRNYLVGYDISDDRRLAKVAKTMKGFGYRLQYSFFHCCLSDKQKNRMKEALKKIILDEEDQVIILPVTEKQLVELEFIGVKTQIALEGVIIV